MSLNVKIEWQEHDLSTGMIYIGGHEYAGTIEVEPETYHYIVRLQGGVEKFEHMWQVKLFVQEHYVDYRSDPRLDRAWKREQERVYRKHFGRGVAEYEAKLKG